MGTMLNQKKVFKSVLSNGLTVLIYPKKSAPKVALQMWYNVGSKHEQPGEKGMAHFLEHMIFKGTNEKLSESDINMISQKLAAYANAFTSYDYTAYILMFLLRTGPNCYQCLRTACKAVHFCKII